MTDCIFCKIGKRELPAKLLYEDPELFAFEDIAPQAPTHILICSRKHLETLGDSTEEDGALLGRALLIAARLAAERKLTAGLSGGGEQRERGGADRLPLALSSARRQGFSLASGLILAVRTDFRLCS